MKNFIRYCFIAIYIALSLPSNATIQIDFDDIPVNTTQNISTRYQNLGVRFDSIANPFPLLGAFPAPENLPEIVGDVFYDGLQFGTDFTYVAVSTGTGIFGENGILMSFAFDVSNLSLQGVDLGNHYGIPVLRNEDENVTLTAYNQAGEKLGYTYSTLNLDGPFDITPASISFPNMRYVAFNYTGDSYGFYALDNLSFTPAVPEPETYALLLAGLGMVGLFARRK